MLREVVIINISFTLYPAHSRVGDLFIFISYYKHVRKSSALHVILYLLMKFNLLRLLKRLEKHLDILWECYKSESGSLFERSCADVHDDEYLFCY